MDKGLLVITPIAGAAIALAVGVWLGGLMQPQLITDRLDGPQTLVGVSGERFSGPFDDGAYGRYGGKIPDYVIGTDATRPLVMEAIPAAPAAPEPELPHYEPPPRVERAQAAYEPPPPPPVTYPSTSGGAPYDSAASPPPAAAAPAEGPAAPEAASIG